MTSLMHNVYRVEFRLGLQDPLMGPDTRYHNILFIETQAGGSGRAIQVNGTIANTTGMLFYENPSLAPEASEAFHQKYYPGQIRAEGYGVEVKLLEGLEKSSRQRVFDTMNSVHVKCKSDGSRYEKGETETEYWKCTEWMSKRAIPALEMSKLLMNKAIS